MLTKIFELAMRISPRLSRAMIRFWYQMLVVIDRQREITFMNYGYADLDARSNGLALNDGERDNREGQGQPSRVLHTKPPCPRRDHITRLK